VAPTRWCCSPNLRGFTGISEQLEPHCVVPLLNEFFSLLTEITFRHEGNVFHMAGDCLMLGFGVRWNKPTVRSAPCAPPGDAASLRRLSALLKERYRIEAGLGIGITRGTWWPATIGSPPT